MAANYAENGPEISLFPLCMFTIGFFFTSAILPLEPEAWPSQLGCSSVPTYWVVRLFWVILPALCFMWLSTAKLEIWMRSKQAGQGDPTQQSQCDDALHSKIVKKEDGKDTSSAVSLCVQDCMCWGFVLLFLLLSILVCFLVVWVVPGLCGALCGWLFVSQLDPWLCGAVSWESSPCPEIVWTVTSLTVAAGFCCICCRRRCMRLFDRVCCRSRALTRSKHTEVLEWQLEEGSTSPPPCQCQEPASPPPFPAATESIAVGLQAIQEKQVEEGASQADYAISQTQEGGSLRASAAGCAAAALPSQPLASCSPAAAERETSICSNTAVRLEPLELRKHWVDAGFSNRGLLDHLQIVGAYGRVCIVDKRGERAWVQWPDRQGWTPLRCLEPVADDLARPMNESELQTDHRAWHNDGTLPHMMCDTPEGDGGELASADLSSTSREMRQLKIFPDEVLGRGSYGTVYKGWHLRWGDVNHHVAVKTFEHDAKEEDVNAEAAAMRKVDLPGKRPHPNILRLFAFFPQHNLLVMEYCEHKTLFHWLGLKERGRQTGQSDLEVGLPAPSLALRLLLMWEVAAALAWLAERGMAHCDLKMKNILVARGADNNPTAKVADFGFAHEPKKCEGCGGKGTPAYRPPEVCRLSSLSCPHSEKSDVWSFAVVLYGVLRGKEVDRECFVEADRRLNIEQEIAAGARPRLEPCPFDAGLFNLAPTQSADNIKIAENIKNKCHQCLSACFQQAAEQRPSFIDLCQDLEISYGKATRLSSATAVAL